MTGGSPQGSPRTSSRRPQSASHPSTEEYKSLSKNRSTIVANAGAHRRTNFYLQSSHRNTVKSAQLLGTTNLYRAEFGNILFDNDLATDTSGEDDKHERLVTFWRVSARSSQLQVPVNMVAVGADGIDFFVSHVWQPPTMPRTLDLDAYALQKVETLTHFCISQAGLAAGSCNSEDDAPWFLRDPATLEDIEEEDPARDPKHAWREWQCWVDKACAMTPGAVEVSPNSMELAHTTKAALRSSKRFLAVLAWQYFSRLWCVFEWVVFVARIAPHYRQIELAIPEACIAGGLWPQFIETASSFSLASLRAGSEIDHPQLWRELEKMIVSTQGFERFMQATALALLARYALLLCTKQCPAFSATIGTNSQPNSPLRLEPLVEACTGLGMHALAAALHSAKPRGWWNMAYRRAKERNQKKIQAQEETSTKTHIATSNEAHDDPMERLWKAMNQKANPKQKKDEATSQKIQVSDSVQAASYAMRMISKQSQIHDAVTGSSGAVSEIHKRLSASPRASQPGQQLPSALLPVKDNEGTMDVDEEDGSGAPSFSGILTDQKSEQDWLQDCSKSPSSSEKPAVVVGKENVLGQKLSPLLHTSGETHPTNPQFGKQLSIPAETEVPKGVQDMKQGPRASKMIFGGLPDGLGPFWRGLKGKPLSESERVRAKVFRDAWIEYRSIVDKWFDKHVCPKLEVWRQRGIRISSLLDETFGSSFFPVGGALQDVLCDSLTPKARELLLTREPPPRGRPAHCFDAPWDNPALSRLILMAGRQLDAEGELEKAPVLLSSSLPLKMTAAPRHNLLCVRFVESDEWKHVAVPQSLGAEALTNALKQLFEDRQITKLELEVVVPRLALKVRGLEGFESLRVVLGAHVFGVLRNSRRRKCTVFQKDTDVSMPLPSPTKITRTDEHDGDEADPLGWNRWRCSHVRRNTSDGSSEESDDGVPQHRVKPGFDDGDNFEPQHRFPVTKLAQAALGESEPIRVSTPRRAAANGEAGQLAFEKARANIMGVSKEEARIAVRCAPSRRKRRLMGPGGLLPHNAVLAVIRPPDLSKVDLATVTKPVTVQRPRPKSSERLPQISRHTHAGQERAPSSARAQSAGANEQKDVKLPADFPQLSASPVALLGQYLKGRQNWQWSNKAYGGAALDEFAGWSGTFRDIFSQLHKWTDRGLCQHWVPIDHIAQIHGRPFITKDEDTAAVQPQRRGSDSQEIERTGSDSGTCAQGPECSYCGQTDVVTVMLDHSILSELWGVPACRVCLSCSNVEQVESAGGPAESFDGDAVLEVCTTVLLRAGTSSSFQQLAARVLRVDSEQVFVAAPVEDPSKAATGAKSRLAHISICGRSAGISAAVVTASCYQKKDSPDHGAPFKRDHEWVHTCLRDTGLDLKYGEDRPIAIDFAIGELDDRRTLPRRVDVSPLVLWIELRHVLSRDFDIFEWCRASMELLGQGKFSLVAAITMKQNTEKLRKALGLQTGDGPSPVRGSPLESRRSYARKTVQGVLTEVHDEPLHWPLALHRAIFTERGCQEDLLGAALNGAGVDVAGPSELIEQGLKLIVELHGDGPVGDSRETKQFASAVRAVGSWKSSITKHQNRGSAIKNDDASAAGSSSNLTVKSDDESKFGTTRTSVMFQGLLSDVADEVVQSRKGTGKRMTLTNVGRRALDPSAVMRNLTYRRHHRGGDPGAEVRAALRARRLLRLMQVSSFLTKLHDKVTAGDDWRLSSGNDILHGDQESNDSSSSEEDDDDDEGAPSEESMDKVETASKSVEELTVQKVLGHAKEYVHHGDIILKCLQVLNIIVQTCSTFLANATILGRRGGRGGRMPTREVPLIERVALEQGFSRTALRAIYRHWKRPEIGAEALKLLTHMLSGELQEDIYNRACAELSSPPERVLTLIMAAGKFSEGQDLDQLRSTLKVLLAIATWREKVPNVPVEREDEAASILMKVMFSHEDDGVIFEMTAKLVNLFLGSQPLCIAFFNEGLGKPLRSWLAKAAEGNVTAVWRNAVEEQTKDVKVGHSGKAAMLLRRRLSRIKAVPAAVGRCEKTVWQIVGKLISGGTDCQDFASEAAATIQHGVGELRRLPRGGQWSMALSCLSSLVLDVGGPLAEIFIGAGGLELMLDEVPEGEVANVLPLMLGLLIVEGEAPEPDKVPGETDDEDQERELSDARAKQMERRDSKQDIRVQRQIVRRASRGEEISDDELRRLQPQEFQRTETNQGSSHKTFPACDDTEDHSPRKSTSSGLSSRARTFFTRHGAVTKCLDALVKYRPWPDIQTRLFNILAELFRGEEALINYSFKDFEHFKGELGGGLQELFRSLRTHTSDKDLAKSALSLLTNLMQRRTFIAPRVADLDGSCEVLMQVAWRHLYQRDVRRRALICARAVRKATPSSVDILAISWTAQQRAKEEEQEEKLHQGIPSPAIPADMMRFGALVFVHRWALSSVPRPIMEVVQPLCEHTRDKEIVNVGISALMRGTEYQLKDHFKELADEGTFPTALNRILLLHPQPQMVLLIVQMVTGILQEAEAQTSTYHSEEYASTAAMALSTLFEVTTEWKCQTWEAMLATAEVVGRMEGGVDILDRYELVESIEDEWDELTDSDEETARMIVKQFHEETKRIITMLS